MYKGVCLCGGGGRFADFISFFFNIRRKCNNLVMGYLKMGGGGGGGGESSFAKYVCVKLRLYSSSSV